MRLSLAITGHRIDNAAYAANQPRVKAALTRVFDAIADAIAAEAPLPGLGPFAPVRLHTLLADGVDQLACDEALARGWDLVSPLPFGAHLNRAINAKPDDPAEARALLAGALDGAGLSAGTNSRAQRIRALEQSSRVFALADQDDTVARLYLAKLEHPEDRAAAEAFAAHCSERVGMAARVMIEQSDILIGIWDGVSHVFVGGTGHTIEAALEVGSPVVWIDANNPERWRILRTVETLAAWPAPEEDGAAALAGLVRDALRPTARPGQDDHAAVMNAEPWRPHSDPLWHAYRRIEAVFGGDRRPLRNLRQTYEPPQAISAGSGAQLMAAIRSLPGGDPALAESIDADVLARFAWSDGISSRLSDAYRGGMIINFIFSAFAIVSGIAYLPFARSRHTPIFAAIEILLLGAILGVTWLGQRRRWHKRWFETRRVAEYFRQAPILLTLGVARPAGRWPAGADTAWPEWYARYGLREVGLPRTSITQSYLRATLTDFLDPHVLQQRDYHLAKARRLTNVHHNLDHLSERMFALAVISVAFSLALMEGGVVAIIPEHTVQAVSRWLTFLDVLLPAFGGAVSGIRYFGDFERFAAISEVTANKLEGVHARIRPLLAAPETALEYGMVADIAHAADDIVVSEIENWQAVFGSKHISVPV